MKHMLKQFIPFLLTAMLWFSAWPGMSIKCEAQTVTCSVDFYGTACAGRPITFFPECTVPGFDNYSWWVNGQHVGAGHSLTQTFTTPGSYRIKFSAYCDTYDESCPYPRPVTSQERTVYVSAIYTPNIASNVASLCESGGVTLNVTNVLGGEDSPIVNYTWRSEPAGHSGTGSTISVTNIFTTTTFFVESDLEGGCTSPGSKVITVHKTEAQPVAHAAMPYHKRQIIPSTDRQDHYWQTSATGQDLQHKTTNDYYATEAGTYFIRKYNLAINCWTNASTGINVQLNYVPPQATISQVSKPGYTKLYLMNEDQGHLLKYADYHFVNDASSSPQIISSFNNGTNIVGDKVMTSGTYYLKGRDRGTGTWGPTLTLTINVRSDESLNWVYTKSYDGMDPEPLTESKAYFDETGNNLQSQTKDRQTKMVWVSQSLRDRYDRVVGTTLAAPITGNQFRYDVDFLDGYNVEDFDYVNPNMASDNTLYNPKPVNDAKAGSLGWYYSGNNTLEPFTPATDFPYSRTEYYEDGTGESKRSASPGDQHHLGSGHEILSGTFPVYAELNDYVSRRTVAIPGIAQDGSLFSEGVQTIVRDQNGRYSIAISDKGGKSVMQALKGSADNFVLQVNTTVTGDADSNSPGYKPMLYFYLLDDQPVSLVPSSKARYTIEDIVRNKPYSPPLEGSWAAGFYKISMSSGTLTVSYKNYYRDVSYQFYDDAGNLKVNVSPNGFKKWREVVNPATNYALADKTTYRYNFLGLLQSVTETDAGTSNYLYRRDGRIRFSQNAQQQLDHSFSYTHYDKMGRPVESGEYTGTQYSFNLLSGQLEYVNQILYTSNVKDWQKSHYDEPVASIPNLPASFKQDYIRGALSWTENANIKTWYSYDEFGRLVWMAQKPAELNRTFVTRYTYNFVGNVLTVKNSAYVNENEIEPLYHHYSYDRSNRLSKVYTSTNGSTLKHRATYHYYLHGPLKRIELGDGIQGIDFVYNIHGWLTQINHPNKAQDPGEDDNDVFGMVIDYYESSIPGLITASTLDPMKFHGLTSGQNAYAMHQPLIRFEPATDYQNHPAPTMKLSEMLKGMNR
jgi:hypothetical protein